ncbi:MAG TPA: helix-turn-helix domain-containing protein [Solirubrobacteraceae bacterium]|nr:helix-turn-helix domain-containing protein [Solirubrobacteraceae bacterium]
MRPTADIADHKIAKALAHPLRMKVLSILDEGIASPKEIAARLDEPINTVSYHVRVLADLGLIRLAKRTPRRGAVEHHYRAEPRKPMTSRQWAELPATVRKASAGEVAARVAKAVETAARSGGFERPKARLAVEHLELDADGWRDASDAVAGLEKRLREIAKESKGRGAGDEVSAGVALMLFDADAGAPASA